MPLLYIYSYIQKYNSKLVAIRPHKSFPKQTIWTITSQTENSLPQLSQESCGKWNEILLVSYALNREAVAYLDYKMLYNNSIHSFHWKCIQNIELLKICFPTFIDYINYCDKNNNFLHLQYSREMDHNIASCHSQATQDTSNQPPETNQKQHHHNSTEEKRIFFVYIINNGNKLILYF